jgi:XTP/dITP diphosphohydrolase
MLFMSKKEILIATNNPGKAKEFQRFFGENWVVKTGKDISGVAEVIEDTGTYIGNASKKAKAYSAVYDGLVLADDSGLEVDALPGELGVETAYYAGHPSDAVKNTNKLLETMRDIPDGKRGCQYRAVLVLAKNGEIIHTTEGVCRGELTRERREEEGKGFGYDPIFLIPDLGKTFAQISIEEKEPLSHRGKALKLMAEFLKTL